MDYEQRLKVAAKIILESDSKAEPPAVNCELIGLTASLKSHQVEGVSWLIRRYNLGVNVILGDEMGLGKTLQAIALMCYLKTCLVSPGPFLVLCPLSVTDGWVSETKLFAPKLRVLSYIGGKEHRLGLRRSIYEHVMANDSASDVSLLPFDVLLTTYDIALMDQDFLSQFAWHYAVIDEAQRLKNPSSVLYNVLKDQFVMPRRLLMTGTPIQNNLTELWALMHFCMPSVFGSLDDFLHTFKEVGDPSAGYDCFKVKGKLRILKSMLAALMLRRTKSKLIKCGTLALPPLTEITVMVPLVALQKKVYASILRNELPKLLAFASGTSNFQSLQNMVIQLRKACSHPYLFPGIEPEPYEEGEHLVQASGKLMILDQLLQRLHGSGHRVLLFAQMTHTLDILQDFLEYRQYSYERLDGSVRAEERFAAIRSFSQQAPADGNLKSGENAAFVFMISTRAGGVGLNLVAADTVIFYEQDWNPQVDRQALQRAHRIGQMNHVLSISLVTGQTVEEAIMRRAQRKLQLSHDVVGEDIMEHVGNELSGSKPGDLRSIIYGLHTFDPTEVNDRKSSEPSLSELSEMVDMVISKHHVSKSDDGGKLEISPKDLNGVDSGAQTSLAAVNFDPGVDEASYHSWVEKFREVSKQTDDLGLQLENRRKLQEEKLQRIEAARDRAEEKKLTKWQSLGYVSLSVTEPGLPAEKDMISDSGGVHFVVGDCTNPSTLCPSEPSIIFCSIDDSGNWGHGGMFDALAKLSTKVPQAYQQASEFKDLHLGDLHLIHVNENHDFEEVDSKSPLWVALAIVQSYNSRRKVPRSSISIPDLDRCLRKVSFSAARHSASIHMPRIGYQDGSDRAIWYSTERLLRKYASIYRINIYVYYYRRS